MKTIKGIDERISEGMNELELVVLMFTHIDRNCCTFIKQIVTFFLLLYFVILMIFYLV